MIKVNKLISFFLRGVSWNKIKKYILCVSLSYRLKHSGSLEELEKAVETLVFLFPDGKSVHVFYFLSNVARHPSNVLILCFSPGILAQVFSLFFSSQQCCKNVTQYVMTSKLFLITLLRRVISWQYAVILGFSSWVDTGIDNPEQFSRDWWAELFRSQWKSFFSQWHWCIFKERGDEKLKKSSTRAGWALVLMYLQLNHQFAKLSTVELLWWRASTNGCL